MSQTSNIRLPFGGKRRLFNVIKVRLPNHTRPVEYDAGNHYVEGDMPVVVDTKRGAVLARSTGQRFRKVLPEGSLKPVLRIASKRDIGRDADNRDQERQAYLVALKHIRSLRLDMKLLSVEILLDRSRTVFYFSADGRIDFRELVRKLSRELRGRVVMHQVGVRNGAGLSGGIGSCGRELCCSTFLNDFEPVAIRMVKDQGLTLNPKKVSGMCGRLMCCLVYEHSAYVRGKKTLPRRNHRVITRMGPGKVKNTDIVSQSITVLHDDGIQETFPALEVIVDPERNPPPEKVRAVTIQGPVEPELSFSESEEEKPKRRRRRRRSKSKGGSKGSSKSSKSSRRRSRGSKRRSKSDSDKSSSSNTSSNNNTNDASTDEQPKRKRRRRRRRRRKPDSKDSSSS